MSMQSSLYRRVTVAFGTLEKLPLWALELVDSTPVARLGLRDSDGAPRVMPVTFARVGGSLWTAVDSKPKRAHGEDVARVRWLRASPAVALTVDRYDDDWSRLAWVQVLGVAAVAEAASRDDVLAALAARYPAYRADPPPGPLIELRPERILCWRAQAG
jgi:PPOX class probable F420-dependent enzyme